MGELRKHRKAKQERRGTWNKCHTGRQERGTRRKNWGMRNAKAHRDARPTLPAWHIRYTARWVHYPAGYLVRPFSPSNVFYSTETSLEFGYWRTVLGARHFFSSRHRDMRHLLNFFPPHPFFRLKFCATEAPRHILGGKICTIKKMRQSRIYKKNYRPKQFYYMH